MSDLPEGLRLPSGEAVARALVDAIHAGDVESLSKMLAERPGLAPARIVGAKGGSSTPLHAATDWPGYLPNGPEVVRILIAAGANPNVSIEGTWHAETPLHWAASSDDVEVARALIDAAPTSRRPERRSPAAPRSATPSATAAGRSPACSSRAARGSRSCGTPPRSGCSNGPKS